MLACPVVTRSTIIAGMNRLGHHGEHQTRTVTFDRSTGRELNTSDTGGIGIRRPHYVQQGNTVVTTDGTLRGYQITASR